MSIESDLKKDGIIVTEPLDYSSVYYIAQNVSKKIYNAFPNYEFTYEYLLDNLSKVSLYIAEMPYGLAEASYFYKNSSIYFRSGMSLKDVEKYSVHEYIHHLQVQKDETDHLIRMGLCEFNKVHITGMALNEAAVQIITSNVLDQIIEPVEYYGITFPTISPNVYPLICNLVSQMAYITGEDVLFESTFDSNDHFKNKFVSLCGSKAYEKILSNLDQILDLEEKIIILSNKLEVNDFSDSKRMKITNKISTLKQKLCLKYFETQSIIITSFSETMFNNIISLPDIDHFRSKLYAYQDLIGIAEDNKVFNDYYISMMERLEVKAEELTGNAYMIPVTENKFIQVLNKLKKLISFRKHYEEEDKAS